MVVNITPTARSKMTALLRSHDTPFKALLFSVRGGGCNGFNYHFEPTMKEAKKFDEVVKIDDDHRMIVCGKSLMHVIGVTIDYKNDIMGSGFEFENPNASGKCGCGKSFH